MRPIRNRPSIRSCHLAAGGDALFGRWPFFSIQKSGFVPIEMVTMRACATVSKELGHDCWGFHET